jgi:hypothetical protein
VRSTLRAFWLLVPDPFFSSGGAPSGPFGYWFLTLFSSCGAPFGPFGYWFVPHISALALWAPVEPIEDLRQVDIGPFQP